MKGLWTFPIVLPNNPLKWLNCYVIKGENGGRNLLVDTGFNHPDCRKALQEGIDELGLKPELTDVFITHFHSDHSGNAAYLQSLGYRLVMGEADFSIEKRHRGNNNGNFEYRTKEGGMPGYIMKDINRDNPATKFMSEPYEVVTVNEGDILSYNKYNFECIGMSGHTPGHMCLYDAREKIMFLGDHVLFDITPNICAWPYMEDALGTYMDNLLRLKNFDVELALPAHRSTGGVSLSERVDKLILHHKARLDEAERIICEGNGLCAYEIAGLMTWRIRSRSWDEFPAAQKIFAYGETLAHLDYLVIRERIIKRDDGRLIRYYGKNNADKK